MGTRVVRYIPEEPTHVPPAPSLDAARALLEGALGATVVVAVTEGLSFVDPGENLDAVRCPACGQDVDLGFWQERMAEAGAQGFTRLELAMPCCGAETSLHDLEYEMPAGFARVVLEVTEPQADPDEAVDLDALERALGCLVRRVDARY